MFSMYELIAQATVSTGEYVNTLDNAWFDRGSHFNVFCKNNTKHYHSRTFTENI